MGLTPGIRTGVKVAVVSDTGKVLDTHTVYPHDPRCDWEGSLHALGRLVATQASTSSPSGNGTASRETDKLAAELIKRVQQVRARSKWTRSSSARPAHRVYSGERVREQGVAGARSGLARERIARRLQDPLAEW